MSQQNTKLAQGSETQVKISIPSAAYAHLKDCADAENVPMDRYLANVLLNSLLETAPIPTPKKAIEYITCKKDMPGIKDMFPTLFPEFCGERHLALGWGSINLFDLNFYQKGTSAFGADGVIDTRTLSPKSFRVIGYWKYGPIKLTTDLKVKKVDTASSADVTYYSIWDLSDEPIAEIRVEWKNGTIELRPTDVADIAGFTLQIGMD